jgi:glycosyltransferase involved in cell wall biosynthesis
MMDETRWLSGHVTWIENPSDTELEQLYRSCDFTVYPSLFEGWGLPVGESLWFRKRCIASRAGGIPEVGIDAVDYIDPLDVSSITAAIVRHAEDDRTISTFNDRVAKAPLRSWSGFGSRLLDALASSRPAAGVTNGLPDATHA